MKIAQDMLGTMNSILNLLNTLITGDETWVYGHDHETNLSNVPKAKKKVKVMLTIFFDSSGVVRHRYASQDTAIAKEYYQKDLRHLCEAVKRN